MSFVTYLTTKRVADLRQWEKNPKHADQASLERLGKQLLTLKQYKPLIVTTDDVVLAGNQRLAALRLLGVADVWCLVIDRDDREMTEGEKVEIALADNNHRGKTVIAKLLENVETMKLPDELSLEHFAVDSAFIVMPADTTIVPSEKPVVTEEEPPKLEAPKYRAIVLTFSPDDLDHVNTMLYAAKQKECAATIGEAFMLMLLDYDAA